MDISHYTGLDPTLAHVLLFRHAERHEITDFTKSTEALLTRKGKADAHRLGSLIAGRFDKKTAYHSPVRRCAQTAEGIIQGAAEKNSNILTGGELSWLGGDFIQAEVAYINDYMLTHGWQAFLRDWYAGRLPTEKIQPLEKAAPMELELIKNQLKTHKGLVIDITHDWNLMILLEYYLGLRFEKEGLPDYLACLTVSPADHGHIRLSYLEKTVIIESPR